MSKPFISVIIPTYNRKEKLQICLQRLEEQTLAKTSFEVIVVNDGSHDGTKNFLEKRAKSWPELRVIHQINSGQGRARNQGIKKAKGQIILFLGDDIYPEPEFLREHHDFHKNNPQKKDACLGLTLWYPEKIVTPYMNWLTDWGLQFAYYRLKANQEASFWFFYTSNISLKKELLKKDSFDEHFQSYGWEDIELAYRLSKKGMKITYQPNALAYHDHFMAPESLEGKMKSIAENAKFFQKKHPELKVIPSGMKRFIFFCLSNFFSLALLYIFQIFIPPVRKIYWYALSKKYYLKYT